MTLLRLLVCQCILPLTIKWTDMIWYNQPSIQATFCYTPSRRHLFRTKPSTHKDVSSAQLISNSIWTSFRPWEPPCEDNDLEAEIRSQQALSAAVDVSFLFRSAEAYIVELSVGSYLYDLSKSRVCLEKRKRSSMLVQTYLCRPLRSFWPKCQPKSPGAWDSRTTAPCCHLHTRLHQKEMLFP